MSTEKVKKAVKALLKQTDNKHCADCPIKSPTWASINLGVFLCLECAGIHRNLGVHISKVRSTELDTWQQEWYEVMKKIGNKKANKYWEAKLPKDFSGRPTQAEAEALTYKLKKFITDKYEKKLWVPSSSSAGGSSSSSSGTSGAKTKSKKKAAKDDDSSSSDSSDSSSSSSDSSDEDEKAEQRRRALAKKKKQQKKKKAAATAKPKAAAEEELDLFGDFDSVLEAPTVPGTAWRMECLVNLVNTGNNLNNPNNSNSSSNHNNSMASNNMVNSNMPSNNTANSNLLTHNTINNNNNMPQYYQQAPLQGQQQFQQQQQYQPSQQQQPQQQYQQQYHQQAAPSSNGSFDPFADFS
ncbi:Arf-GAP with GTPase, ANK repeat and PH domain-containing protein 2 [Hondaea fermentalgiana]|uniref:Arf-GAP with GTPase, ANK repeat and PH domain-containing protein 2 n=1 Tax=Hondaea fermentalgiana TaxID=2315210 RepID=A0A2R5GAP0_9STRA|nr:Arf-GAP with GTPase, ANK repeat and PH domain-containing protein 2 [Hondaea fermentalgiana]|eukprot:GBG28086.1 Arf-GAP with GTPase, ANK repeat and PH domain-containing protein 2 [Hondaea fermentalgiana]